ncbi:MAG: hypothetical protein CVV33_04580 [Methanomicrobiales archaeon HGW-Methanomicrobiales-4]|nr:MAG: hypothetical protein CVV33_04580 [Methanomicrobiales archaeon HGW-Methanomicrobiales-4]
MGNDNKDIVNWIRCLPIRTIDDYCDEDRIAHAAIEKIVNRLAILTRQHRSSQAWHDKERLIRQITIAQEDLDMRVSLLYGISISDCGEIRRRTGPSGTIREKITGIQIFSGLPSDTRGNP